MEEWDNFRLVKGYLPEIDRLPETALKLNLPCRVAAVLNENGVPHSPLYWDLLDAFVESLAADSIIFEIDDSSFLEKLEIDTDSLPMRFTSVSLMRATYNDHPEYNRPFHRATSYVRGKANAFIDVEPWNMCGGPLPYSDSWTFSIYRATEEIADLREACYRVCRQYRLQVLDEMQGRVAPPKPRGGKRLLAWLFDR